MKYQPPYGSTDPDAPYVDRNSATATKGSSVPARAVEDHQRELVALIGYGGLTPDEDDLEQVAKAIQTSKLTYAVVGGSANDLTATLSPTPIGLQAGLRFMLKIVTTNTGPATLNVSGLGAKALTRADGSALQASDLQAGSLVFIAYDGTNFQIVGLSTILTPGRNITSWSVAGTYTFTVPAGVYKIYATCVGAGAGSGGAGTNTTGGPYPAGGGGAGGTASGWINVTPGQMITIIVGAGGQGGAAAASGASGAYGLPGANGGTSSVGAFMSATGGIGGGADQTTTGSNGGAGGVGSGGQINQTGGNGTDGSGTAGLAIYGGNGGGSSMGGGGRSSIIKSAIQNGAAPGSGAGSCYLGGWAANKSGGNGADGIVILQY